MTRNPFRFSASEWLDPPILIAGEVHNSSSSSPKYMEPIWEKADRLNLNTLVLPVTWEMVEEGFQDNLVAGGLYLRAGESVKVLLDPFGSIAALRIFKASEP